MKKELINTNKVWWNKHHFNSNTYYYVTDPYFGKTKSAILDCVKIEGLLVEDNNYRLACLNSTQTAMIDTSSNVYYLYE